MSRQTLCFRQPGCSVDTSSSSQQKHRYCRFMNQGLGCSRSEHWCEAKFCGCSFPAEWAKVELHRYTPLEEGGTQDSPETGLALLLLQISHATLTLELHFSVFLPLKWVGGSRGYSPSPRPCPLNTPIPRPLTHETFLCWYFPPSGGCCRIKCRNARRWQSKPAESSGNLLCNLIWALFAGSAVPLRFKEYLEE